MSKLTDVAVSPKPIKRQKVSTCLKVFSEETSATLKLHTDLDDTDGTTLFLDRFIDFWNIINVKDQFAGVRSRDVNRNAIRSSEDPRLQRYCNNGTKYGCTPTTKKGKTINKGYSNSPGPYV